MWMRTSGDREEERRDAAVCTDAHAHRAAVLVAPRLLSPHSPQTALETVCNTHFMSPSLGSVVLSYRSAVRGKVMALFQMLPLSDLIPRPSLGLTLMKAFCV